MKDVISNVSTLVFFIFLATGLRNKISFGAYLLNKVVLIVLNLFFYDIIEGTH